MIRLPNFDAVFTLGRRARVPLACALMMLGGGAYADDFLQGFKGVRTITQTTASSSCIGQPRTPLCAVETFLACGARLDWELCEKVGIDGLSNDTKDDHAKYKFETASYFTQAQYDKLGREPWAAPGNVEVRLAVSFCDTKGCSPYSTISYALGKAQTGWLLLSWGGEDLEYAD